MDVFNWNSMKNHCIQKTIVSSEFNHQPTLLSIFYTTVEWGDKSKLRENKNSL